MKKHAGDSVKVFYIITSPDNKNSLEKTEKSTMIFDKCPGAANLRTPTLSIKKCPKCGEEVEVFSNDLKVKFSNCGTTVYNDIQSCVQWCKYAKECLGEEEYKKVMQMKEK